MSMSEQAEAAEVTPQTVQVRGGNPDEAELAAVVAVLQAATAASGPVDAGDDRPLAGGWKSYHRVLRRMPSPGREAWRYSARP